MSVRRIHLSPSQQSFVDEDACRAAIESSRPDYHDDDRPQKRRKLDTDDPGWCSVLEFQFDCPLLDQALASSNSVASTINASEIEASIGFEDPIMTISHPGTGRSLFAFVCQEEVEVTPLEKIVWLQKLASKDSLSTPSIRLSTSASLREFEGLIDSSTVICRIEIRFDRHDSQGTKISLKDRLAVLDDAFDRLSTAVNADHFYANIGKLPQDYILAGNENSLQHQSISCRLFPFQKRAVAWMLQREGIEIYHKSAHNIGESNMPPLWECVRDLEDRILYINRHQALSTLDETWILNTVKRQVIHGGILAEVRLAIEAF
jgi:hypothetical protein